MQNPLRRAPEREAYFPHIQLKNEEGYWMRRKWNRFVAGLLSIVLLVTMLPMEVLAAGNRRQGGAAQPDNAISRM